MYAFILLDKSRCKGIAFGGNDQQKSGDFAQNRIFWALKMLKTAHLELLCAENSAKNAFDSPNKLWANAKLREGTATNRN